MSQPQQHHQSYQQNDRSYRGPRRQPGAAPSDGSLNTTALPQTARTAPEESAGIRGKTNTASKTSSRGDAKVASRSSDRGHTPQQHQYKHQHQPQHQQQCDSSRLSSCPASSSPSNMRQRLSAAVTTASDGSDDPFFTITDNDIRRAYSTLKNRLENHSLREYNEHSGGDSAKGQKTTERPPTLLSVSKEICAKGAQYFQLQQLGRTPSVPTGAPVLPTRREALGPRLPTAPLKQTGPACPTTVPAARAAAAPDAPAATNEESLKPNNQAAVRRACAADGGDVVDVVALTVLTREKAVEGNPQLPPSAAAALNDTDDYALDSGVSSEAARTKGLFSLAPSPALAAQSRSRAAPLGGEGATHKSNAPVPIEPTTVELTEGLGSWAENTVAVARLVDEDSRRVAAERSGEARGERAMRCALKRGIETAVKTLPLSFLKNYGYLRESQQRGLERMTRIMRKLAAVARQRAWDRWGRKHSLIRPD